MIDVFPSYYFDFRCIADKCKHTCCANWEIEVDDETADYYNEYYPEIAKTMDFVEDHFCFKRDCNGNCVHLENGLCKIQLEDPDIILPIVCDMHPRFENEYDNIIEHGLGIACEECARIILGSKKKFLLLIENSENEVMGNELFDFKQSLFESFSSSVSFKKLLRDLSKEYSLDKNLFNPNYQKNKLFECEFLFEDWKGIVSTLSSDITSSVQNFDYIFKNLACYLAFRHRDLLECNKTDYLAFIAFSVSAIHNIAKRTNNINEETIFEICRRFSEEIEYSTENINIILDK